MSRCLSCGFTFTEDDGWQDYCCPECLYDSMVRNVKGRQREKAMAKFKSILDDPHQRRRIRFDRGRATPPKVGGGWKLTVRPMTETERRTAALWSGRGFADCFRGGGNRDKLPSRGGPTCNELLNDGNEQPLVHYSTL